MCLIGKKQGGKGSGNGWEGGGGGGGERERERERERGRPNVKIYRCNKIYTISSLMLGYNH